MYHFCDEYPYPFPSLQTLNQKEIITRCENVLKKYGFYHGYKGYSICRICQYNRNGDSEYLIDYEGTTYVIPIGYFHYLKEHNVKIDSILIKIVNSYSEPN